MSCISCLIRMDRDRCALFYQVSHASLDKCRQCRIRSSLQAVTRFTEPMKSALLADQPHTGAYVFHPHMRQRFTKWCRRKGVRLPSQAHPPIATHDAKHHHKLFVAW